MTRTNHPKNGLHSALINDFHLEQRYAEELKSYYVLHWELEHLMRNILRDSTNTVIHNGVYYIPVFKEGVVGCLDIKKQVRLSFRESGIPDIPNYVLIKKLGT